MKAPQFDATDAVRTLTADVVVTGLLRLKVGLFLLGLAARVLRAGLVVNEVPVSE